MIKKRQKRYREVTDEERDHFIFDMIPFIDLSEAYYVDQFIRIKSGRNISWNWMAFLFGPFWCVYRKMYTLGILHLLINQMLLVLRLPQIANIMFYTIFAMFANYIYFKTIEERLQKKRELDEVDRVKFQTRNGGISIVAPFILGIVIITVNIILLMSKL